MNVESQMQSGSAPNVGAMRVSHAMKEWKVVVIIVPRRFRTLKSAKLQ